MERKKWSPKTEVTETLLKFREKRKWQIALRRYILEKQPCYSYAPYFGLDIENFRKWIELQFDEDLKWDNFSVKWQFEHVVPVTYFDFSDVEELKLCWGFINIRVEKFDLNKNRPYRLDVIAAKAYYQEIYSKTGYAMAAEMIKKINRIELSELAYSVGLENFIKKNKDYIDAISNFSSYEFGKLNDGTDLKAILEEREFLKKFNQT